MLTGEILPRPPAGDPYCLPGDPYRIPESPIVKGTFGVPQFRPGLSLETAPQMLVHDYIAELYALRAEAVREINRLRDEAVAHIVAQGWAG